MSKLTFTFVLCLLIGVASVAVAQGPRNKMQNPANANAGQGQPQGRDANALGGGNARPDAAGRGGMQSAQLAQMMLASFDADASGALDINELQSGLSALMEMMRRSQQNRMQAGGPMGAALSMGGPMNNDNRQAGAGREARGRPRGGNNGTRGGPRGR